ncbi:MAG: hypothetical protein IJI06_04920 [Oscillospiraceae bacterium]|jgi:hypothetical protein|nr:hypothetical protein [Oscillospiraceae bacterium]MBR3185609.1 hypothetical protein [Oscillospiraceae bacterium]HAJ66259.1 hypothetical protein [Clostridiales bacterium]
MGKTQWYIGAPNGVVLCINGSNEGDLSGVFYHSYSTESVPFSGIGQMVLRMEKLYDYLRFPYPGTNSRTFGEEKKLTRMTEERKKIMSDDALLSKHGDIGTFIVRVQHRQNSSWQGRITWMEEDKTVQFRSVWEMIKLIESAVDLVSEPEETPEEAWIDKDGQK